MSESAPSRARRSDWKTEPLPAHIEFPLDRTFSIGEMQMITAGLIPDVMEDKWFLFYEENTLFFHRSWTGYCIYELAFVPAGNGAMRATRCKANRDTTQYTETSPAADQSNVNFLIDLLLLRRDPPSEETMDPQGAMKQWSSVGRAMLGQHPDAKNRKDDPACQN